MFKTAEKNELCQISLTGVRAIIILGLLLKAPRSLDEIKETFVKWNLMEPHHSSDIIRIDLNTLRAMGCEISRSSAKTNHKYILSKHPFEFEFTKEEIDALKSGYKIYQEKADIVNLIVFDKIIAKIVEQTSDEEMRERLCGISVFKSLDKKLIFQLLDDCEQKRVLKLIYKAPASKKAYEKEVIAQNLVLKNDKLYLYAYKPDTKESVTLLVKRIQQILSRNFGSGNNNVKTVDVKFKLLNFGALGLENCEKILEITEDNHYIILGKYHNDFVAIQRMLSFGSDCIIIEPEDIKQRVIEKLKRMKEIYE